MSGLDGDEAATLDTVGLSANTRKGKHRTEATEVTEAGIGKPCRRPEGDNPRSPLFDLRDSGRRFPGSRVFRQ